jgi:hypothetical protein
MADNELNTGTPAPDTSTPAPAPAAPAPAAAPEPQRTDARPQRFDTSQTWEDSMLKVWDTAEAAERKSEQATEQPRDRGRFARKQPPAPQPPGEAQALGAQQQQPTPDQPEGQQPEQAKAPAIEPPHSWSAEAKARWKDVPPDVQAFVARREMDVHRFVTQFGQKARELENRIKAIEPFEQLQQQHTDYFKTKGVSSVQQGVELLINMQKRFDTDPVGLMVQLGFEKGFDLRPYFQHIYGLQQQGQPQQQPDPAMVQYLQQHGQKVAQLEGKLTAMEQAEQAALDRHLGSMVNDFSQDKPYFDYLRPMMADLLEAGHAKTLQEAYPMALWAHPETRERVLQYQRDMAQEQQQEAQKAAAAKQEEEARAAAERGRRNGALPVRGQQPGVKGKSTIEDTLRDVARKSFPDWRPGA